MPGPSPHNNELGSENLREPSPPDGRRPDSALDVSMRPEPALIPGMRSRTQLHQKLQREQEHQPHSSWRTSEIGRVDPQEIINTARYEARKIMTRDNEVYRTEAERRGEPLASRVLFRMSVWGSNVMLVGGTLVTAATWFVTGMSFKSELAAGQIIGSPALAWSAFLSGVISAGVLSFSALSAKWLKNAFDNRITKALSSAKATPLAPDKIEWTGRFIANITRMNPCIFMRGRTSKTEIGQQASISYWQDVARDAAVYAHDKCPRRLDQRYEDLQAVAKDIQFDQMLTRELGGKKFQMADFLTALEKRWFAGSERVRKASDAIAGFSLMTSLVALPTIAHHGAFVISRVPEVMARFFETLF